MTKPKSKEEMLTDLMEAKKQVNYGRTYSMEEAKERIGKHLSKWK